jgi:hypothetical protein
MNNRIRFDSLPANWISLGGGTPSSCEQLFRRIDGRSAPFFPQITDRSTINASTFPSWKARLYDGLTERIGELSKHKWTTSPTVLSEPDSCRALLWTWVAENVKGIIQRVRTEIIKHNKSEPEAKLWSLETFFLELSKVRLALMQPTLC